MVATSARACTTLASLRSGRRSRNRTDPSPPDAMATQAQGECVHRHVPCLDRTRHKHRPTPRSATQVSIQDRFTLLVEVQARAFENLRLVP